MINGWQVSFRYTPRRPYMQKWPNGNNAAAEQLLKSRRREFPPASRRDSTQTISFRSPAFIIGLFLFTSTSALCIGHTLAPRLFHRWPFTQLWTPSCNTQFYYKSGLNYISNLSTYDKLKITNVKSEKKTIP